MEPVWYDQVLHLHARQNMYCKECGKAESLKQCGKCLNAVYCSVNCQLNDALHECLIKASTGEPLQKRSRQMEKTTLQDVPADLLHLIMTYLSRNDVRSFLSVSKWLIDKIGYSWISNITWTFNIQDMSDVFKYPKEVTRRIRHLVIGRTLTFREVEFVPVLFPNLRSLELRTYDSNLPVFKYLETLSLNVGEVRTADTWQKLIQRLQQIPTLRRLNLAIDLHLGSVDGISALQNLMYLGIDLIQTTADEIFKVSLSDIGNMQNLVGLYLYDYSYRMGPFDFIQRLVNLRELALPLDDDELDMPFDPTGLKLEKLSFPGSETTFTQYPEVFYNLRELTVNSYGRNSDVFVLPNLEKLYIENIDPNTSLNILSRIPSLKTLEIVNVYHNYSFDFSNISEISQLNKLVLLMYTFDDDSTLDMLDTLINLKELKIPHYRPYELLAQYKTRRNLV
jgi:hypothetical protein